MRNLVKVAIIYDSVEVKISHFHETKIEGLLIKEKPDGAGLEKCRQFGRKLAQKVKQ